MSVITRFAPSPTGYLHIGGARTALFNWLFARHHGGQFLLRVEDTDRQRSTEQAVEAIFAGMKWLGLDWDGEPITQFARQSRHQEIANQLLEEGRAYRCYASAAELDAMRSEAQAAGRAFRYNGLWRDRNPSEAPDDITPCIRLKAPQEGTLTIKDSVQGEVTVECCELDDMILLRSDGTPTYMLAVVVDDHDMGITHVIRGDDHFTNAFRQMLIYQALGWDVPHFVHIPLIHGPDGAKLSKRHGALGVEAYRDMGFLPETMRNYLLRLGWSHGDDEIISTENAIKWFDLEHVGKSPSRFDTAKLSNLNGHYIRERDNESLTELTIPFVIRELNRWLKDEEKALLLKAMESLKQRAQTLEELAHSALFYFVSRPVSLNEKATKILRDGGQEIIVNALPELETCEEWSHDPLMEKCKTIAFNQGLKLGKLMQPVRAAITGSNASPSMFEVMELLGKDESIGRLKDAVHHL
jgi:glutamyl-tRNA synthetase